MFGTDRSRIYASFKMELFVVIVNGFQLLTIVIRTSILDALRSPRSNSVEYELNIVLVLKFFIIWIIIVTIVVDVILMAQS